MPKLFGLSRPRSMRPNPDRSATSTFRPTGCSGSAKTAASAPVIEVRQESKYFAYSYGTPFDGNHFFPIAEKATRLDTRTYQGNYPEELLRVTVPTTVPH